MKFIRITGQLHASHTHHSKALTLRQVMQEILSEYQCVAAAIATDNAEQAADGARRLANHRIPAGGLLPYFPLDKINDASRLGEVATGCVACHPFFRGRPGVSPLLLPAARP